MTPHVPARRQDRARPVRQFVETLETRRLMAVSLTADGWTQFTPASGTRVVHVSSSLGKDTNPGTLSAPVRSIAKAKTLVRDGAGDWLLLRRGDTFNESFGGWTVNGKNAQEPALIGAYGTGRRPLVQSGVLEGITIAQKYRNPLNHVALVGIEFFANGYTGANGTFKTAGIRVMRGGSNVLIEDVLVRGYKDNIVVDPDYALTNFRLRRSVIVDAYNTGQSGNGHAQGFYGGVNARGTLIEENVFDHNGWKPGVSGPTFFNHSIYMQTGSSGTVVRNNIITRSSLRGVLSRGGAVVEGNLLARNPVAVQVGNASSTVNNNVILESNDLPHQPNGKGIEAFSMSRLTVQGNVIAHDRSTGRYNNVAVNVMSGVGGGTISGNTVYHWENGFRNVGAFSVSGNRVTLSAQVATARTGYTDPNRLLGQYNASLGRTSTFESFIASARQQSRGAWDTRYTSRAAGNYIRAGFNLAARRPEPAPQPAAPSPATSPSAPGLWSTQRIDEAVAA